MKRRSTPITMAFPQRRIIPSTLFITVIFAASCQAGIASSIRRHASAVSRRTGTSGGTSHVGSVESRTGVPVEDTLTTNGFWLAAGGSRNVKQHEGRNLLIQRRGALAASSTTATCLANSCQSLAQSSHVSSTSCAHRTAIDLIPRGGSQKSSKAIEVKTEGGNAVVAILLNMAQKLSPALASVLRAIFKIIEKVTGLDLVPVKVEKKSTSAGQVEAEEARGAGVEVGPWKRARRGGIVRRGK